MLCTSISVFWIFVFHKICYRKVYLNPDNLCKALEHKQWPRCWKLPLAQTNRPLTGFHIIRADCAFLRIYFYQSFPKQLVFLSDMHYSGARIKKSNFKQVRDMIFAQDVDNYRLTRNLYKFSEIPCDFAACVRSLFLFSFRFLWEV